jgi:flagellar assembly protein FliH
MLSKVLPREGAEGTRSFVYHPVGPVVGGSAPNSSRNGQHAAPQNASAEQELNALRLKIAEMERVHPAQLAEAKLSGAREAEAAARLKAEGAIKPVLENLAAAVQTLLTARARGRKELEAEAVQLSLAIARRVLRRELTVDTGALEALIAGAYDRVSRQEIIRVVVDPALAAPVKETLAKLSTRQIEVFVDPARERGTLVFETVRGTLDASVDSQFREIELGLADRLKSR